MSTHATACRTFDKQVLNLFERLNSRWKPQAAVPPFLCDPFVIPFPFTCRDVAERTALAMLVPADALLLFLLLVPLPCFVGSSEWRERRSGWYASSMFCFLVAAPSSTAARCRLAAVRQTGGGGGGAADVGGRQRRYRHGGSIDPLPAAAAAAETKAAEAGVERVELVAGPGGPLLEVPRRRAGRS